MYLGKRIFLYRRIVVVIQLLLALFIISFFDNNVIIIIICIVDSGVMCRVFRFRVAVMISSAGGYWATSSAVSVHTSVLS